MDSQEMRRLINGILSSREFFGKYDINSDIDTFNNFVRKNGIDPFIDILTTEKPTNRLDDIAMPVNQYYIASLLLKVSRHLIPQIQDGLQVVMDKITIHQDNDLRERMMNLLILTEAAIDKRYDGFPFFEDKKPARGFEYLAYTHNMQFPIESERIKSGEIAFEKDESKICGWDAGLEYEEIYKYIADEFSYEDRIHFLDHIIGKRCAQGHDPCQLIPSSKKLESRSTKGYICPDCHEFTEFFSGYLEGIDPEYIVFDIAILLSLDTMIEITIKNFSDPILLPYLDIELETLDFHTFLGRGLPSMVLDNSEISVNNKIVLGSEKMHEFIPIQSIVLENQKVNIGKNLQNYLHEQKMEREKWVAEAWGFGEDDVKPQEYSWWPLVFDIVKLIGSIGFLVGIFFLVEFLRDKDLIS